MRRILHPGSQGAVRPGLLAALCLILLLPHGSLLLARDAAPHAWSLTNEAVALTLTLDAQGRLGMTRLRDRRTGYDWCRDEAPSPVLDVRFQRAGEPFALNG